MQRWGLFISLIIGLTLAMLAIIPSSPKGDDAPASQFSAMRAMEDVRIIAAAPHPTGSIENAKVRAYLIKRLSALGLETSTQESLLTEKPLARLHKWSGQAKTEQSIFNVIGVLPGKDRTKPALLLMAHHDTVWASPGAADDTVGIASILEIIRALNSQGPIERDLIVLFTDGEEIGLSGARAFFKEHSLKEKIGAVINFEARGGGGTANMFQTSANNGDAVRLYARHVKEPSVSSLSTYVYNILPNDTDLTPALKQNYTAYNIANIGKAQYYHSPKIDAKALDERTLQHMGSQGLDLTRALLAADPMPAKKPDATFFDVFGLFTVIYSAFWGWLFLAIAALCFGVSVKDEFRPKDMADGALRMTAFIGLGGAALYLINSLSGHNGAANYYDRLAAIPKLEWTALIMSISAFFIFFGSKTLSENGRLGAAIPIFLLGIIGQALAPTATYFISVALMLCGVSSLFMQRYSERLFTKILAVILTALIFGYMVNLGHLLMLGVGPDLLSAAILPAAIAALVLLALYQKISKGAAKSLAVTGFFFATALALWIRLDPIAVTVPLY